MNRTTVKRGIGAVILALIAAALLAFLLKDKAAQRQEVVEIALPGTNSAETSDQATPLPTLTMDNSGNGSVIANAGTGNGDASAGTTANATPANTATSAATQGTATTNNPEGTVVASAAAVGTAAAGATTTVSNAASQATKAIDFSVKPKASKASSEFLDLDLINNGNTNNTATSATNTAVKAATATPSAAATQSQQATTSSQANNNDGVVIASTAPKSSSNGTVVSAVQPRLIGEKRSAPVKSASTAKVITKKAPVKKASSEPSQPKATANQAKNGYAIQLLATSNVSRANNLKKVMAGEGYPTYVTKTKQNGKTLYRVRIGQYAVKSQALKAQAAMKRRYKKTQM